MNVLSLFDGISCARVALDRVNISVASYRACEIDKYAIKVSTKNYPDIERLGSVKDVSGAGITAPIDLMIGGSPCQDLSIAKKGRKGLSGERSSLFWEYVRIKNEVKPKWFILENVASMPKADKDTITSILGVQPIMIDAALVSAQSRKRLFWTNIPNVTLPEDKEILLKDVVEPHTSIDKEMTSNGKAFCLDASYYKGSSEEHTKKKKVRTLVVADILETEVDDKYFIKHKTYTPVNRKSDDFLQVGYVGEKNKSNVGGQALRIYSTDHKSTTVGTGGVGLVLMGRIVNRKLDEDGKRADNNPDIEYKQVIEVRSDDKSGTLTSVQKDNVVVGERTIRRLTPIECERLQGLPDNYTSGISDTQRYKCCGNGFNVDVIAHILSFIPHGGRDVIEHIY
jgi:DNA-cytosine methyltransferase